MKFNKILIGAMRFKDCRTAVELIRKAIDYSFNYIDTAPKYCFQNEENNSEAWIGKAIHYKDYRDRVMISTKSATSNGGLGLGEFDRDIGFGVRSAAQFRMVFEQSLKRLDVDVLDFYHLWVCHTNEIYNEAFKDGGWYEGFLKEKEAGRVRHLGITSHADTDTIIGFLETGIFETVTIPLNILNRTRLKVVEYCSGKNIHVFAMNPLGGGFLAADERIRELAFKFLLSLNNVSILAGLTSLDEVEFAKRMEKEYKDNPLSTDTIVGKINEILSNDEPRCTGCGYCQPCPNFIEVGAALSYYNLYKYLELKDAKKNFLCLQWNPRYKLNNCVSCGICERRCPNALPVRDIIKDAVNIMY